MKDSCEIGLDPDKGSTLELCRDTPYPTKPMLYVRWEDIMDYGDRAPMSIAKERRLAVTETCGFVISEDDETITLDQHICHIPEITEPAVQNYTVIPKVLIQESRPCNLGMIDKEG